MFEDDMDENTFYDSHYWDDETMGYDPYEMYDDDYEYAAVISDGSGYFG